MPSSWVCSCRFLTFGFTHNMATPREASVHLPPVHPPCAVMMTFICYSRQYGWRSFQPTSWIIWGTDNFMCTSLSLLCLLILSCFCRCALVGWLDHSVTSRTGNGPNYLSEHSPNTNCQWWSCLKKHWESLWIRVKEDFILMQCRLRNACMF